MENINKINSNLIEKDIINKEINKNIISNKTFDILKEIQISLKKESSLKKLCKNILKII